MQTSNLELARLAKRFLVWVNHYVFRHHWTWLDDVTFDWEIELTVPVLWEAMQKSVGKWRK